MVTITDNGPNLAGFGFSLEQMNEDLRQEQVNKAIENLQQNNVAIDRAITAIQQNAQSAQKEAEIAREPGKFSQPIAQIAELQARQDEIVGLIDQLENEPPGATAGLDRYNENLGRLYSYPEEWTYNPNNPIEISYQAARAAPQTAAQQQAIQQSFNVMDEAIRSAETQAQQQAAQQSFNVMDEGIRSAPTPMTQEQQEIAAMMETEATIAEAQAQVAANNLSAMSMMANQAAAEAFSNAIAAGATVAEATAAAEAAAQTAAQQAATQVGINPNSPTVTEAAMNAVNTQAVEIGRLAGMTPEQVAAAAQQAVTLGQQGKIGKNTLSQLGLLGPLGLAITAPEVEARRAMEAQEIMERAMLNPAPVSPPTPAQNPLGTGRGVSLPTRNLSSAFQVPRNQHELNAQPPAPPVEPTLVNPAFNIEGFTVGQATPTYSEPEQTPVLGTTLGQTTPGLGPNIGLTAPQAFGVTGYSPGFNNLNDIGFTDQGAQPPDYTNPQMSAAYSFFNNPEPVTSFESYSPPGLTLGTMPEGVPGFSPSNAPQISAVTPVSPVQSFFSAPEPVAPDATPVGPGTTVSGVQSSVPGISISPTGMTGVRGSGLSPAQHAQVTRGNVLGSLSLSPDPPSPNPSRGKSAITSMMDVEEALGQQQAQQERAAINSMMALEAAVGQQQANQAKAQRATELDKLTSIGLPDPAPTTSRSSSRGRSSGRSSSGRSSRGAARSTATRSVATWGPEGQVTFSEEAADPGGPDSGKSIVCSAMNRTYGFGSFRNKLWIEQSKNLDPAYERGYHAIFLPLIAFAYAGKSFPRRAVKTFLEHAARRRTADIWKQKRGRRDWIGACERAIMEPICYLVGKMLGPKRGE